MDRSNNDGWVILTTAGVRTLPLARALNAAGIEAWTPMRIERRTGRGKKRKDVVQVDVAICPTFVFARRTHVVELLSVRAMPVSPYPAFRIMQWRDRIPVVSDASLGSLRAAEERFRQSMLKTIRRRIAPGTSIRLSKGAFAGMTGIVEGSTDREAKVKFGSGFIVSIATYMLGTDVVQADHQPALGLAA